MSRNLTPEQLEKFKLVLQIFEPWVPEGWFETEPERNQLLSVLFDHPESHWPTILYNYIKGRMTLIKQNDEQFSVVVELVKRFFPTGYNSAVEQDIKNIFFGTGYGEWPDALQDYIRMNSTAGKSAESFRMTFQEVSELIGLLPPRAPKELEVVLDRNAEDELQLEFVGKINVPTTIGRKKPE